MTRTRKLTATLATAATLGLVLAGAALPAAADTLPDPACNTTCTATFDTVGSAFTFAVPANIISLTATVSGGAGAAPTSDAPDDPTAVGGAGGVTTVTLGTDFNGEDIIFGVGGTGEGSYIQGPGSVLLAVAGGGGQGGYAGYTEFPDQISATYPGGEGGAPSAPGVAPGGAGTAFGGHESNGGGGTAVGGTAGVGTPNGNPGESVTTVTPAGATLAAGGAGASLLVDPINHLAGVGGSGYTGGGGGAIALDVEAGDVPVDVVAAGGGGAGYLDAALTAVAGTPNTGSGSVSFTWTFAPVPPAPAALPSTGVDLASGALVAALLVIAGAAALVIRRKTA
jgi:LPXTG-motif cell wall-anchored protein